MSKPTQEELDRASTIISEFNAALSVNNSPLLSSERVLLTTFLLWLGRRPLDQSPEAPAPSPHTPNPR